MNITMVLLAMLLAVDGSNGRSWPGSPLGGAAHSDQVSDRDKTGTESPSENSQSSQKLTIQALASPKIFQAEGKGFEPSTGCPAPDFESGR